MNELLVAEYLRLKDKFLFHRENQELEFKEQFNFAGLAEYFRDFAAFANNRGGYLIFGVQDSPRLPVGLKDSSIEQFERIDPEQISGSLLEIFSSNISWEQKLISHNGGKYGVFYISESQNKPVIAKKDEGRDLVIKNGEIYFRYGGRTQKIQYADLQNIIEKRVETNNKQWLDLMSKIGTAGPQNAAILDTEKGLIEKDDAKVLVIDEELVGKLKFVREGQFSEKVGATTLKLVGDVVPINKLEIIKKVKENLLKQYPLSSKELVGEIKKKLPDAKQNYIWDAIKENSLKINKDYCVYVFKNKMQEDEYEKTGKVPVSTANIYNQNAVDFLVKVLSAKK